MVCGCNYKAQVYLIIALLFTLFPSKIKGSAQYKGLPSLSMGPAEY